jgi:DNA-binding XRE family transcriptional regulator
MEGHPMTSTPPGFQSKDDVLARRKPNRERVETIKREMLLDIGLNELRERTGVTQAAIAERMETSRPNIGRIEGETDIRLSTLQRYVGALGGSLRIEAVLPDGEHVPLLSGPTKAEMDALAGDAPRPRPSRAFPAR